MLRGRPGVYHVARRGLDERQQVEVLFVVGRRLVDGLLALFADRTAPELQATSRHQHLASLGRYVRLGEETSARLTAEHDPAARRRSR
ncbi:hypothetical protein [Streptosporangium canum]|uniref:hypothetical protein n=1 Tax=Streptosporangium canum TaxID=324952 RepID=UPI003789A4D0